MADAKNPETLPDLLRTLERSGELRSLARECGLSVRELRRRLAIWRRELSNAELNQDEFVGSPSLSAPKVAEKTGKSTTTIKRYNKIKRNIITPGQKLKISECRLK